MRWKNTLAVPIVALLLVVAIGMLLIGYVVNDRVFFSALEEREKDKANSIRFATRSIIDAEVRRLSTMSKILNTDKDLSAGVTRYQRAKGDLAPLKSAMDDLFAEIDTQIFVVTDLEGVVLYRANEPLRRGDRERVWGLEEAAAGAYIVAASEGPNGWAIRALAPIRAGTRVVGVLILGTRIDDELAGKISRETGARISFANLNGVLTGSSPPERTLRYDPSIIREVLLQTTPIFRMDMGGYRAVQYTPLQVVDETFCLIIETDMGGVRGMLLRNRLTLAKTAALILAGVLLLGITVTTLLVRPLKKLEREAREVVREFTGKELAPEVRGNEIDTLAAANHRMVEAIRNHISAREEAEVALRQSEVQLRQAQKMETVGRLAGGIAHDFNNLLTVINGYSDVLLRRLGDTDPSRREIGEIHKAGERAAALTRQLLAFSRKQVLEAKSINLNESVTGMSVMIRRLIGENIELATALDPDLRTILADPGQIEQVVLNLAVNARDAMPSGGTITISTANVDLAAPEDRDGYTPSGGSVRASRGRGHRVRDGRGDDGAHVRTVLHDEGAGKRDRIGAGLGVRDREAERRAHPRAKRAGPGNHVRSLLAGRGRGSRRGEGEGDRRGEPQGNGREGRDHPPGGGRRDGPGTDAGGVAKRRLLCTRGGQRPGSDLPPRAGFPADRPAPLRPHDARNERDGAGAAPHVLAPGDEGSPYLRVYRGGNRQVRPEGSRHSLPPEAVHSLRPLPESPRGARLPHLTLYDGEDQG